MPEGDSYTRAADRLRPILVGRRLEAVEGVPAVRRRAADLVGRRVEGVRTHGKHLLIDVEGGLTLHTWLGMPGRWRVWRRGGRMPDEPGAARLLLSTTDHVAGCFAAPTVEVERRRVLEARLSRLGPDILADELDLAGFRRRASLVPPDRAVAEVLLDQRVLAGVGNEYACEVLFLERLHPETPWGALTPAQVERLVERARRLMLANAHGRGDRVTTGMARPGLEAWVFERTGKPCRRCRSAIRRSRVGDRFPRLAYWCPRCQPLAEEPEAPGAAGRGGPI